MDIARTKFVLTFSAFVSNAIMKMNLALICPKISKKTIPRYLCHTKVDENLSVILLEINHPLG